MYFSEVSLFRLSLHKFLQSALKNASRFPLQLLPNHIGVPIVGGMLKGKLLPKETARQNSQMWLGRYESIVVSKLFSMSEPVRVAYDVGAHVGYMTLALAESLKQRGMVFAFEPIPHNLALIEKLIYLNNLRDRIRIVPFALGGVIGV
jgi:hypothetical protein